MWPSLANSARAGRLKVLSASPRYVDSEAHPLQINFDAGTVHFPVTLSGVTVAHVEQGAWPEHRNKEPTPERHADEPRESSEREIQAPRPHAPGVMIDVEVTDEPIREAIGQQPAR